MHMSVGMPASMMQKAAPVRVTTTATTKSAFPSELLVRGTPEALKVSEGVPSSKHKRNDGWDNSMEYVGTINYVDDQRNEQKRTQQQQQQNEELLTQNSNCTDGQQRGGRTKGSDPWMLSGSGGVLEEPQASLSDGGSCYGGGTDDWRPDAGSGSGNGDDGVGYRNSTERDVEGSVAILLEEYESDFEAEEE